MNRIHGMLDLPPLADLLQLAAWMKRPENQVETAKMLQGKSVVLCFEKPSTRTRMSFEMGIQRLGGYVATLDSKTSQMSRGESLEDTARVLSRYGNAIVYRAINQESYENMAKFATVPVVNALSELEHPCQILADLLTMQETIGDLTGKTVAYVGDGNNVCNSLLLGAAMMGMNVHVATPSGFKPDANLLEVTQTTVSDHDAVFLAADNPIVAMKNAHFVATDTWVSMGDEGSESARKQAFANYTLTSEMFELATPNGYFMHCLPGHWGEEATEELAHSPRSLIYDEAENRMWAQMALLVLLLNPFAAKEALATKKATPRIFKKKQISVNIVNQK